MGDTRRWVKVVSAAIVRDDKYLITRRMDHAVLPGLWEFPGGKVEAGESDSAALERELRYRLGVEATVIEQISAVKREYADYGVELHLYRCDIGAAEPEPKTVADLRWVCSSEFGDYEFTPADEKSLRALLFEE